MLEFKKLYRKVSRYQANFVQSSFCLYIACLCTKNREAVRWSPGF
jgi:hypothetical protein